jgi:uncharacterized membrane protein
MLSRQSEWPDYVTRMKFNTPTSLNLVILIGVIAFFAVCLHSIEEIHYLKSFFPAEFTVEEAFYAAAIELIKVIIIGIPILLIIYSCLRKLRESKRDHTSPRES